MIRMGMFTRLAWVVGPLVLPGLAPGQEAKPAATEASVPVTEGRVVVVEDGPNSDGMKPGGGATTYRQSDGMKPGGGATTYRLDDLSEQKGQKPSYTIARPVKVFQPRRPFGVLQALGVELAEADDVLRSQLQLPAGEGAVVVAIRPDGPADQSGLKANDVIVALEDAKIRGVGHARDKLLTIGKDPIQVKLIRGGKETTLSLAGPKHGEGYEPQASEYWIGVPVSPVDATLRSHLADLPADIGLIANDVVADSPAAKAGIKKNDILVKIGGNPLRNSGALVAQVQAAGDKPTPLELLRGGKPVTVTITPAKRSRTMSFTIPGQGEVRYDFNFAPVLGVAVTDPKQQESIAKQQLRQLDATLQSIQSISGKPAEKPLDIHLEMLTSKAKAGAEEATAKIETGMRELKASIDELKKAIEALKKPEGK